MKKIDKSLVDNDLIFPTAEFLEQTFIFQELPEKTRRTYSTEFTKAIGA
jgi:spermidine/putrescine transport system substrate-binding protein